MRIGGDRPWDVSVHDDRFFARVLGHGSLGAGESYMEGWWDCPQLDELCARILRARLGLKLRTGGTLLLPYLKARLLNLQTPDPLLPSRPAPLRYRERFVPGRCSTSA